MDKCEVSIEELEQLALRMAQALRDLDCPECCEPVPEFMERVTLLHREKYEWACLAAVLVNGRIRGKVTTR